MPLEKEEQKSKKEEGEEMSREDLKTVVQQLFNEREEKSKASGQLSDLGDKVQEVIGGLANLQKLFCAKDGGPCFATKEQLEAFMATQKEAIGGLESKITGVETLIGQVGQGAKGATKDWRKLSEEQQIEDIETLGISHGAIYEVMKRCSARPGTDNDRCRMLAKVLKDYPAEEIFQELPEEKRGKITSVVCTNRECRVQLENEQAIRIYKKGEDGKYRWLDEPKPEKSPAAAF